MVVILDPLFLKTMCESYDSLSGCVYSLMSTFSKSSPHLKPHLDSFAVPALEASTQCLDTNQND